MYITIEISLKTLNLKPYNLNITIINRSFQLFLYKKSSPANKNDVYYNVYEIKINLYFSNFSHKLFRFTFILYPYLHIKIFD